jgi:cyclopropane fatty-acyl-phospholipid synthase-like methyltransferase
MHYGFWEKGVKTRHEAVVKENEVVASYLNLKPGMKILDLGCGIGGTAMFMAKRYGVNVVGVTLDPNQVEIGEKLIKKHGLQTRVVVKEMDFMNLSFENNYFDGVYGIESVCYAYPKTQLFKHVIKTLKPGGKFVIADGYKAHSPINDFEVKIIKDFCEGFVLPELLMAREVSKYLKTVGFENIKFTSKKNDIALSVKHFGRIGLYVLPIVNLFQWSNIAFIKALRLNALALERAYKAYELGFAEYGIHVATKPG